ncbi:hypothetical protein C8F04DRAFT_1079365 [Mycena alexandri]|uniref:F-box domain-containing protein n=1 Tax=Mycena alexandri TaxID=1745969 RepID=A0AAD6XDT7_9AGAR|nr:hypothetical protein C8F04DRAFT_1079365 [Mycena alexandri]
MNLILAARRARIADIDAKVLELQRSIQFLQEDRAPLQDDLDAYRYPVLTLPPEIVAEIFMHFLPGYPHPAPTTGLDSPTVLTQVCQTWRQLALSTPSLWRAVTLCVEKTDIPPQDGQLLLMTAASLARSGSCSLSVELISERPGWRGLDPFVDLITTYSNRLEHLKLRSSPSLLRLINGPLVSLRCLTLCTWKELYDDPHLQLSAPLLQKVAIQHYHTALRALIPWAQLTVLVIASIPSQQCGRVLALAVNLVYCEFTISRQTQESSASTPLTMHHLETLVLRVQWPKSYPVLGLIDVLTLPALIRLNITEVLLEPSPTITLSQFISRSGCRLQKIHLTEASVLADDYHQAVPTAEFSSSRWENPLSLFYAQSRDAEETLDLDDIENVEWEGDLNDW